jgi:hypothetical protein
VRETRQEQWQHARHYVVALFLAYALLVQALAGPFLSAQALGLAGSDGALAQLCLGNAAPAHETPGSPGMPGGHGLECCLPGLRLAALDAPALVATLFLFAPPTDALTQPAAHARPQTRAPPASLVAVLQPRAPPPSIL